MTDRSDIPPKNNSNDSEIESPVDGPQPDWMRAATSSDKSSFDENRAPDWLKAIRAGKGASSEEEAATSPSDSEAHEAADDDGMSDLERLLAEEGIDLSTVSERRPEDAEGMSAKDWLISTSDDDLVRKRLDDTPMESSLPPSTPSPAVSDDSMSDIERLLAEEGIDMKTVAEDRPEGAEGMSAKDWLISTSDDDLVRKRLDMEPIPDIAATPAPEPVPSAMASSFEDDKMVVSDDLPDWLQETSAEETESVETVLSTPESLPEEGDDDKMVVSDNLPDWLQEIPDEEPAVETLPSMPKPVAAHEEDNDDKMVVLEDLPDWLQEVEEEDQIDVPTVLASEEAGETEDIPDWLRDVEKESLEETFKVPASVASTEDEVSVDTDDLPDWLRYAREDEAGEVTLPVDEVKGEEAPDWLKRVQAEQDQAASSAVAEPLAEAAPSAPEPGDSAEDLPDWLRESEAEEEPPVTVAPTDQDTLVEAEDLPDWLQEVEIEGDDLFEPSEPSPDPFADVSPAEDEDIVEEDLPDWLQEVQKEKEEEITEAPITALQAEPEPVMAATTQGQDDLVHPEDLPDWLQEVEEGGEPSEIEALESVEPAPVVESEEPAVEPEPAAPEEEAEPISEQADTAPVTGMPDWLKKLREGDETEEAPKPQPAPIATTPRVTAPPVSPPSPSPPPPPAPSPVPMTMMPETVPSPAPAYEDLPSDVEERLKLAQIAGEDGDLDEIIRIYNSVVAEGTHLDVVIDRIQQAVKLYPNTPALYQIMGDAMMRDDRLQSALEAYRSALANL